MAIYHVLYNPFAGNFQAEKEAKSLTKIYPNDELHFFDMTKVDYTAFFAERKPEESVIICGGDGTVNRFINDTDGIDLHGPILYYACGSGNDFMNDLGKKKGDKPFVLDPYFADLPTVEVNGMKKKFFNGIGYGIDGYCCEIGDKQREAAPGKTINYTSIAIKGLLYDFKRTKAKVTVDGVTKEYKHVWLAPTMNGRFYGGGMNCAPDQDRLNKERTVSCIVMHCPLKLYTLIVFPSIFKGEHVKHTKMVEVRTGHEVHVEFDKPTALQIDGETVLGVTEYTVHTAK